VAWVVLCMDNEALDTAALRRKARDAHFAYIESVLDRLLVAGPLAVPGSKVHKASLFIYAAASAAEARALVEADPFFLAGIYARIEVHPFTPAAGQWIGGTLWGATGAGP